jgi:hypothetical protein
VLSAAAPCILDIPVARGHVSGVYAVDNPKERKCFACVIWHFSVRSYFFGRNGRR